MQLLAATASLPEVFLSLVIASVPLVILAAAVLWVFRLIKSLRERLDAIEDKIDLISLRLEARTSKKDPPPETSTPQI